VRVVNAQGQWVSRACECQEMERQERRLAAAHIPERYRHCSLDTYVTDFNGANPSLVKAKWTARKFAEAYPVDTAGNGLLFVGTAGLGKTHLAVALAIKACHHGIKVYFTTMETLIRKLK